MKGNGTSRFKIAFAVKRAESDEYLDKSYYVEWKAMIYEGSYRRDLKHIISTVAVHKCDKDDWDEFYPMSNVDE